MYSSYKVCFYKKALKNISKNMSKEHLNVVNKCSFKRLRVKVARTLWMKIIDSHFYGGWVIHTI